METPTQTRLRRIKEHLENLRETETRLISELTKIRQSIKSAKEKYEDLFNQEEHEEIARRKENYNHQTN